MTLEAGVAIAERGLPWAEVAQIATQLGHALASDVVRQGKGRR